MWIICVDAEYVLSEFFEVYDDEEKANNRYRELEEEFAEQIENDTVTIYLTKVTKKS